MLRRDLGVCAFCRVIMSWHSIRNEELIAGGRGLSVYVDPPEKLLNG